ncbi:MAG: AraC family transcriptional regulator [Pseudomonadota bacterium]
MERSDHQSGYKNTALAPDTKPTDRLRMFKLAPGDVWPQRNACELVLVLDCRAKGFELRGLDGVLCVGELVLLPVGNDLTASAKGRVLSLTMGDFAAPSRPERLSDQLIALLMKRAWASSFSSRDILEPTFQMVEVLAANKRRAHQEHLDAQGRLDPRITRALDHIDAHLGENLTVAKLAEIAYLSPGHFSRNFKSVIGTSVWQYVTERRCKRAKELLETTSLPIAEIAFDCGFAHQGHLTRCFKDSFGMTPGSLRS